MRETWVRFLGLEDFMEKEMATHSSILAWRIPGMGEPGGLPSMGFHRVRHIWATSLSLSHTGVNHPKTTEEDGHLLARERGLKTKVTLPTSSVQFSSFQQLSHVQLFASNSLQPHGLLCARLSVHHQLLELIQTHGNRVSDAIQPSHPLCPLLSAFNNSLHQGLVKWVSSSHQVAISWS